MLRIERRRQADGYAAQRILCGVECLAAEIKQSAEAAAGNRVFCQRDSPTIAFISDLDTGGIGRRPHRHQIERLAADYQRLAVADEDIVGTVLLDDGYLDLLAQVGNDQVALIQQIIGRLAAVCALRFFNRIVELGKLLRIAVDGLDAGRNLVVDAFAQIAQLVINRLELCHQCLAAGQHGLPCRIRTRVGRQGLHALEKFLHRRRQADRRVGQHVVDLLDLRVVTGQFVGRALRRQHATCQVVVIDALDTGYHRPFTNKTVTRILRRCRALRHQLAAVAGGIRIGDVMPGRGQTNLCGVEGTRSDVQNIGHDGFIFLAISLLSTHRRQTLIFEAGIDSVPSKCQSLLRRQ